MSDRAGSPPPRRRASLTVALITRDEERNLPRCLASIRDLADQVVVVDSGSTDRTVEIARAAGAEVSVHDFPGYVAQSQRALEQARCDWILALDADEWVSPELRSALAAVLENAPQERCGWRVERRAFVLGAWIRHGGWSEWKLRLVRRGRGRWAGAEPHPHLACDGEVGRLRGPLCHVPYTDLGHQVAKLARYAAIAARSDAAAGRRPSLLGLLCEPPLVFAQRLLLQSGWRDGVRGVALAGLAAFYFFLRHARRWETVWRAPEPGAEDAPGS